MWGSDAASWHLGEECEKEGKGLASQGQQSTGHKTAWHFLRAASVWLWALMHGRGLGAGVGGAGAAGRPAGPVRVPWSAACHGQAPSGRQWETDGKVWKQGTLTSWVSVLSPWRQWEEWVGV